MLSPGQGIIPCHHFFSYKLEKVAGSIQCAHHIRLVDDLRWVKRIRMYFMIGAVSALSDAEEQFKTDSIDVRLCDVALIFEDISSLWTLGLVGITVNFRWSINVSQFDSTPQVQDCIACSDHSQISFLNDLFKWPYNLLKTWFQVSLHHLADSSIINRLYVLRETF